MAQPTVQDVMKSWTTLPTRALIKRYQRKASVDKARSSAVCSAYKQFIALKVLLRDYDDEVLAAPAPVHEMWMQHVIDTAAYAEHMRALCGRMLHHAPDAEAEDVAQHTRRCHRALLAYKKHFPGAADSDLWYFQGLPALSREEERQLAAEEPTAKRAKQASGSQLTLSIQAPFLPLRTLTVSADASVGNLFAAFVEASGSTHLVQGRRATPPTTRLRFGNEWLHDLQLLADAGVKNGGVVFVALPHERHSRDQIAVAIKDVAGGESASVFARASDTVAQLMKYAQDALGVSADSQQVIFRGSVLDTKDTLASRNIVDGSTVQMVVGRRREKEAEMSPGGTWRVRS